MNKMLILNLLNAFIDEAQINAVFLDLNEHLMCITVEVNIKIIISRYNFIPILNNRRSGTCFVLSQSY